MCNAVSVGCSPYSITQFIAIAMSLSWLCITPFGRPVVPGRIDDRRKMIAGGNRTRRMVVDGLVDERVEMMMSRRHVGAS